MAVDMDDEDFDYLKESLKLQEDRKVFSMAHTNWLPKLESESRGCSSIRHTGCA